MAKAVEAEIGRLDLGIAEVLIHLGADQTDRLLEPKLMCKGGVTTLSGCQIPRW